MQEQIQNQHINRRKKQKSPQNTTTYKSPYFASVRRNYNNHTNHTTTNNKNRMSAQNAIMITKYPTTHQQSIGYTKKKVFKRFNKFQQIDQLYNAEYAQPIQLIKKNNSDRGDNIGNGKKQSKGYQGGNDNNHKFHSNPKNILYSSKTLALVQKYRSYKSIIMSTPKMIKQSKQKIKRNSNFRTKTKSGNTIKWTNNNNNTQSQIIKNNKQNNSRDGSNEKSKSKQKQKNKNDDGKKDREKQSYNYNQDWLCKQLIQNQVYGMDQDDY